MSKLCLNCGTNNDDTLEKCKSCGSELPFKLKSETSENIYQALKSNKPDQTSILSSQEKDTKNLNQNAEASKNSTYYNNLYEQKAKVESDILDFLNQFINISSVVLLIALMLISINDSFSVNESASLFSETELYIIFAIQSKFIALILWLILSSFIFGMYFLWSKAILRNSNR